MIDDTIVSIATPAGKAGVAIVRLSGDLSKQILKNITHSDDFLPRYMYLKNVHLENIVDDALVVYFKAPNSFTGEDVAEIQCHGGYYLADIIVKECIKLGARMAEPGEYSKRAFLNGKMSIDQAEGIIDIINAESSSQIKQATALAQGVLFQKIKEVQTRLTDCLADIEAKLDYPEYEYTELEVNDTKKSLEEIKDELKTLQTTKTNGLMIKNGVKIAIVGAPNVGKSSLLNALTDSDKSIVTNIAGTTRDIVEAEYTYKGIVFRLFDTAGIHESDDVVEKIGIDRALKSIKDADLVLNMKDVNSPTDIDVKNNSLNVFNKIDLNNNHYKDTDNTIYISAKDKINIDNLKEKIFVKTIKDGYNDNQLCLTNIRHIECINSAIKYLTNAIDSFDKITLDFIVADLNSCWSALGEITGESAHETIIDRVFQKFCLGK